MGNESGAVNAEGLTLEWDFSSLIERFKAMGADLEKAEQEATLAAAKVIEAEVVKNIPRSSIDDPDYRHMADDVQISSIHDDGNDKIRIISGSSKTRWKWKFLEYGTYRTRGNAFASRAVSETKDAVVDVVNTIVRRKLKL